MLLTYRNCPTLHLFVLWLHQSLRQNLPVPCMPSLSKAKRRRWCTTPFGLGNHRAAFLFPRGTKNPAVPTPCSEQPTRIFARLLFKPLKPNFSTLQFYLLNPFLLSLSLALPLSLPLPLLKLQKALKRERELEEQERLRDGREEGRKIKGGPGEASYLDKG